MGRFGWSQSFRRAARLTKAPRRRSAAARRRSAHLAFETLERRWLLTAEIHGFKWSDNDGDAEWDANEPGLAGVTIYLDADDDAVLDDGEQFTLTAADDPETPDDETGAYSFVGLEAGNYVVREVVPDGFEQTYPEPPGAFDLEVVFPDDSLSPTQQAVFIQAAARWEEIIRGDVPDVMVPGFGLVDDIVIEATGPEIDGPGGILGQAGPRTFRVGTFLPSSGIMQFDQDDINDLIADGQFDEVILHEMAHVLGFGTIWDDLGLLQGLGTTDPQFTGEAATAEYNAIFGNTAPSVPVEGNQGGPGTLYSHWDEQTFANELMTGFLNNGVANPISRITVGQWEDLGYEVDLDAADDYDPSLRAATVGEPAPPRQRGYILAIDEPGLMVEPLALAILPGIATTGVSSWNVELTADEIVNDVNFGNKPLPGAISGGVWNDRDRDGVRDEGEPGLEEWVVFLDENGNGTFEGGAATIDSVDVPQTIFDLSTATSEITVEGLGGAVTDLNVTLNIDHSHDADLEVTLVSPLGTRVLLFREVGGSGNNFTNTTLDDEASASIEDGDPPFTATFRPMELLSAMDGEEANGVWTLEVIDAAGGDSGSLNSWSISMVSGERSTITDASGVYAFTDLPAGDYVVGEKKQDDWLQTFPPPPETHAVSLVPGQLRDDVDFGNVQGRIEGAVWNDRNGDGVRDDDEPALAGWVVFLDENGNGALDAGLTTVASTDAPQDIFDFATITSTIFVSDLTAINDLDVTLNISHTYASDLDVFLISPSGTRIELFTDVGLNGDDFLNATLDDEAETAIGSGSAPFTGSFRPEGLLSELDGENPNGAWTLEITDDAGADGGTYNGWSLTFATAERSFVTDDLGAFVFEGMGLGAFVVAQVPQPGWTQTTPPAPGTYEFSLAAGQWRSAVNFGNRAASIQGRKFNDLDNDGEHDEGEPGLPGWIIYLDGNHNGQFDNSAASIPSTHDPLPIPDLDTVKSTLAVSGVQAVNDLNVTISINHTYVTDVDVYLISPSGTRVELFTDVGGTSANFVGTTLDDEASTAIFAGTGPFAGSYRPEGLLSTLDGEDPTGTWTLEVSDDAGNDTGSLVSWSLTINSNDPYAETDADGYFAFYDLTPGAYEVGEVEQPDWTQTYPAAPGLHVLVLEPGQQQADVNFGAHTSVLSGDYDDDGGVAGFDFLLWQRELGSAVAQPGDGADGDNSGTVDAGDLAVWAGGYGGSSTPEFALATAAAAGDDDAFEAAFAELDAASIMGPLAYLRPASSPGAARSGYRPTPRVELRAASVAAALVVAASEAEGEASLGSVASPDADDATPDDADLFAALLPAIDAF